MQSSAEQPPSVNGRVGPELREAIEQGRLELYFQPIVSLSDRSATTLEALPRWPHPRRGILAPPDFFGAAVEDGLIAPLESWAIGAAFAQLARWSRGVAGELSVTLNLAEEHVFQTNLAEEVEAAAARNGVSPRRLGFEISETALLETGGRSIRKLRDISRLGVGLTIDDYRGNIGAERLRELPATALKISLSVVERIPDDPECLAIAESAVTLGRDLALAVIATGIESPGQAASLRDIGCEYGQGFLYSIPMPAEVLEDRMPRR